MDPVTLGFVAFQVGVSLINQWQNSELTAKIKEEQRKAKLDEIRNHQRRDMERFQRLCQLQEDMEAETHIQKIEKIKQDFLNSFEKMAHKDNLDNHYHLNVSPYIIQRSIIPGNVR
jgi:myo-inositol-1-phosphate synthase